METFWAPIISNFYEEVTHPNKKTIQENSSFWNKIGVLTFLNRRARPGIASAVWTPSQFSTKPTSFTFQTAKREFGYFKKNSVYYLHTPFNADRSQLTFSSDFYYAGDKSDRKSRSGWVRFWNNEILSWSNCKQLCVSLSTAEVKHEALSDCCSGILGAINK